MIKGSKLTLVTSNLGALIQSARRIHMVGIGGIGMSYLARYFLAQGVAVSGSDLSRSPITQMLKQHGIGVTLGRGAMNWRTPPDLVIRTKAVPPSDATIRGAHKRAIPVATHAEVVGELTKRFFTIAVAGSHGKSTTTAMLGIILAASGLEPTVFVGTLVPEFGNSSMRFGGQTGVDQRYLVLEADEWDRSFLEYSPRIIVLTNVDYEHPDTYPTRRAYREAYAAFLRRLPTGGLVVVNGNDPGTRTVKSKVQSPKLKVRFRSFSRTQPEANRLARVLKVPGEHNVMNGLAAITTAKALGVPEHVAFEALASYRGAWRRFESWGHWHGALLYDDYAHNPAKVRAAILGARAAHPNRRLIVVFQPHQMARFIRLKRQFVEAFLTAAPDVLILTDIYRVEGRESTVSARRRVSSRDLVLPLTRRGADARYVGDIQQAVEALRSIVKKNDLVMTMGAGDIWRVLDSLKRS